MHDCVTDKVSVNAALHSINRHCNIQHISVSSVEERRKSVSQLVEYHSTVLLMMKPPEHLLRCGNVLFVCV